MEITTVRLPPGTLQKLQTLAYIESLRLGRRVSAAELMRGVIQRHLLDANEAALAQVPAAVKG